MKEVVIASAVRTPVGCFNGALASVSAVGLGSIVINGAIGKAGIKPGEIDGVIMGNVLSAGLGQAPARQASIGAGLPYTVNCLTVDKVCGSGLMAVILASQAIAGGDAEVVVAGGMESMSRAPYILENARFGYRMGNGVLIDSMIRDGLWDVYNDFHMGSAAEIVAERYRIGRDEQDRYALQSYRRAIGAQRGGSFIEEIIPVTIPERGEGVTADEEPTAHDLSRLGTLPPVFKEGGTITAGNSSKISDGASAVVLMSGEKARELGIRPMARIVSYASQGVEPRMFSIAPAGAIRRILEKTGLTLQDIDLFEVNEAFAASILAVIRELDLDEGRLNINGGSIALGHSIGASGARILTTLLHAMERRGARRGIAAICIGGGEAVAMLVEKA